MTDSARLVTVLGGYGIFGGRVAEALARDQICRVRIVGRSAGLAKISRIVSAPSFIRVCWMIMMPWGEPSKGRSW